jgi:hypothetical protein
MGKKKILFIIAETTLDKIRLVRKQLSGHLEITEIHEASKELGVVIHEVARETGNYKRKQVEDGGEILE